MADTLDDYLARWAGADETRSAVRKTLVAIAGATAAISAIVADGPLAGALSATLGKGADGYDEQKELDVRADALLFEALKAAPVAAYASEEAELPVSVTAGAPLLVAIDPLDGSSNIDTDVTIGTIFSVLPAPAGVDPVSEAAFFQTGRSQLAAGYTVYGPHTALVLSVGEGTVHFVLDRKLGVYRLVAERVTIPAAAKEFAINMSNHRHWDDRLRLYIDDLLQGKDGPREVDYNMRWIASMVAEAHRIIIRGGIYLYPADTRAGYTQGRLRLVYEAFPIALLMEQAGAAATDGRTPILDLVPEKLHQRVPLIFGSREKVDRVSNYLTGPGEIAERSPLFGKRGLLTA
ncbi:class 1 fructose-bisphosphatase [Rhodoplanes sp. TEM]|uniref:Fructose-1,6-bisphosphatase class 1 n=1 Tax=Rhodoplanes tepidamans TaxID=200616 RepID=A0ABT5JEY2_RHOTP|nr:MULTISPECIES: class 1 fructose-bisphosphatase [Rhodoplanes]MDC7787625.1 class 1 fructose-bisphosphatase [Rhodoplanes tepidamans]MDC7984559.1 class 1 fructose-bisphosphatase [Rhodoplanes sp. TEM]MDQ0355194.1 fructose-1,6-bisphosphatase I [Rhodoplanes tepidamans]